MLGRWFRRSPPIQDRVWIDAGARARGLRMQAAAALQEQVAVLVLSRSIIGREALARDLAAHAPWVGGDRFAVGDLPSQLRAPAALGLASIGDLRPTPRVTGPRAPLQVHVEGRDARRADDRRLLHLLAPWAPALVVFHHSLDDPLLRSQAGVLQPLLARLGLDPAEPIASPLLSRAIGRGQRP